MNDVISRQATIDALWGIQRSLQMIDASEGADITIHGVQLALHEIEQLPSAQPEVLACGEGELSAQPEIVRCKYCKWRDDPAHWLGCPILNMNDNNYCSYAERRTDD